MGINPVKFGKDVIDQFGRYLRNTFPIADENIAQQLNDKLRHSSDSLIAKGPFVYLNKPFVEGMPLKDLSDELGLHKVLSDIFPFPSLHIHQERAIRAIDEDKNLIVSTGTGSGKTESFLLPILDSCLKANDKGLDDGVMAIIVYPMNALVNDQLERLRPMLAGTGVTFGRYTGETPQTSGGITKLENSRPYTASELEGFYNNHDELPIPFEECFSRAEITEKKPRILLTNYSQLEYLLLRDKDLELFRSNTLKFMVLDEVHTYTGELGSEMACLLRRIKGLMPNKVTCVGTSATVANEDSSEIITTFASNLFGEAVDSFAVVEEEYKDAKNIPITYKPDIHDNVIELLEKVIEEVHSLYLKDEVHDISDSLLALAIELSGYKEGFSVTKNIEKLGEILVHSSYINTIETEFSSPKLPSDTFARLKTIANRKQATPKELEAELLAYLIFGAIAKFEGEPVLRPKLHYFVKGLYGVGATIESDNRVRLHFEPPADSEWFHHNFKACRNCGQHYFGVVTEDNAINEGGVGVYKVLRPMSDFENYIEGEEKGWYLTNNLNKLDEDSNDGIPIFTCKHCGAIHTSKAQSCCNPKCRNQDELLPMNSYHHDWKKCASCSTNTKKGKLNVISNIKSVEVFDIMILGQSMLSAMQEKELQKLLIFADSRQDAAFQAGWMSARSKRFHLRYLNYMIVNTFKSEFDDAISYDSMVEKLSEESVHNKVFDVVGYRAEELNKRIRWYLYEEYCSNIKRFSVEKLGLVKLVYEGIVPDSFMQEWADRYECEPQDICNTITLILDYFRSLGAINDDMAKRLWSYADAEVRSGIISYIDNKYPSAFVFTKTDDLKEKYKFVKSFRSGNGRSSAEVIVKKSLGDNKRYKDFIEEMWDYLLEKEIIVESKLIVKRQGSLAPLLHGISQKTYQINKNIIGFSAPSQIYKCQSCNNVSSVMPLKGKCTKYHCKGVVELSEIDTDDYDVIQYTQMHYTPMRSEEHSAQVPKEARDEHEKEFKSIGGKTNCLVATPTLEMGVDIGKLEMVLMRNVPPSTPNYTQRAGRAGRRHRIATVFTYARSTSHDSYFFNNPQEMITGDIKIPTFSMRNQPLVKKHIHSAVLTWLRINSSEEDLEIVAKIFPPYIKSYIATVNDNGKSEFKDSIDTFEVFGTILTKYIDTLEPFVADLLLSVWPENERQYITQQFIVDTIRDMPNSLYESINNLFLEVRTYRNLLKPLRQIEVMSKSEEREFRSFNYALNSYLYETQGNYTLSYLSKDGFFPSYSMGRESVRAQCAEPLLEISRPKSVAIRELTPANKLYANRNIFDITGLNFYRLKEKNPSFTSEMIRKQLVVNTSNGSITPFGDLERDGGDTEFKYFGSYEMVDVTLKQAQQIDDIKDSRVRLGFQMSGMMQPMHKGGNAYRINDINAQYLDQGTIRLINLGLYGQDNVGFPICPKCGAVRNPRASETEINDFMVHHTASCNIHDVDEFWSALHADIQSDILVFDEFSEKEDAVNFMESLKIGAYRLLDMQEGDLDATIEVKHNDAYRVVFFDPLPGGSGFLPLFFELYTKVIDQALLKLQDCDCEESCYKCMLSFTNQQHHSVLNRYEAMDVLERYKFKPEHRNNIPAVVYAKAEAENEDDCDSNAECAFRRYLESKNFTMPDTAQYRVELGGGSYTIADFAYVEHKVLIFIDGLSEGIHGNPQQQAKDDLLRAKAKMKGFSVVALSAQAMKDEEYMSMIMDTIALYIGG